MCVAAVIFEKVPLHYLECMEADNPHGAGVAWEQDGGIYFLKGLTAKEIHGLQEAGAMTYPYLLHFRWATHGDKVAELTHPFPLGPRALLGETSGMADRLLIHNGTWNGYEYRVERFINQGNYELPEELVNSGSDTALAAWLAEYDESLLDHIMWATALAEMRWTADAEGNKKRTMDITTRGSWYDKEGNWYSNLNWVPSQDWKSWAYPDTANYVAPSHSAYEEDGWEHYKSIDNSTSFDASLRANDKGFVGKYSDVVVDLAFYNTWTSKKDDFKPDLVDWSDWYIRFWGPSLKGIKIDGKITSEKAASECQNSTRPTVHNSKVNSQSIVAADERHSWHNYLVTKYGPEVAREIHSVFFAEADDPEAEGYSDIEAYETVLKGWDRNPSDPEWLSEGDVVTDDPSAVNAWIARQMIKGT